MKHLLLFSFLLLSSLLTSCEKNGQGSKTYKDGSTYIGEWKDGKKWNGTQYELTDLDEEIGNITHEIVNGEIELPQ